MSEEDIIFSTYEAVSVVITTRLIDKGVKPLESFSSSRRIVRFFHATPQRINHYLTVMMFVTCEHEPLDTLVVAHQLSVDRIIERNIDTR